MCSRGVSNGPWHSFPPPLPFHFLITSPLPSLTGAQTRLSLCYSTFHSNPHFLAQAWPHGSRKWAFATVISLSCPMPPSHNMYLTPPSSAHTWNGSQIISSTLNAVRQLLSLLVTSSPPDTAPCSTLSGPSSIISIPHSVGVTTLLVVSAHDSWLYYCRCSTAHLSAWKSSFCCWSAAVLSAHQGATELSVAEQETGRWRPRPGNVLPKCMFISDWLIEWVEPSIIHLHALFVSPSSQPPCAPLLIIILTQTATRVCVFVRVCMCVIYSGYGLKQEQVINSVTSWQEGKSKCCSAYS